jgi:nicotinamide-nucleotide amidase
LDQNLFDKITALAEAVSRRFTARQMCLAVAESCTGGWVSAALTSIPGSSSWFDRAYVTYSNSAKQQMLGVSGETLETFGAVSEQTVEEMTGGVLANSPADAALAISGVAGPGGGTQERPVGTVCFSWQLKGSRAITGREQFPGTRDEVRAKSVIHALEKLLELTENG